MVSDGGDALRNVLETSSIVVAHTRGFAVHDLARISNITSMEVDEALQTHADTKDGNLASEVLDCLLGDTRIGLGVAGTGGDEQKVDLQQGEVLFDDGIVSDHGHPRAEQAQLLVQVPGERVEIIDHEDIELALEDLGERRDGGGGHGGRREDGGRCGGTWVSGL